MTASPNAVAPCAFTPGPWRAEPKGGTFDIVAGPDYFTRTFVAFTGGGEGVPTEANAHLIAAAPDLREALENIVVIYDAGAEPGAAYIDDARAALAKAEGRSL